MAHYPDFRGLGKLATLQHGEVSTDYRNGPFAAKITSAAGIPGGPFKLLGMAGRHPAIASVFDIGHANKKSAGIRSFQLGRTFNLAVEILSVLLVRETKFLRLSVIGRGVIHYERTGF